MNEVAWASSTVMELRNAVKSCLPTDIDSIVVGCSGGPDSLILTAITCWIGERAGFDVHAVTVDHQLQVNSRAIAETAARHALTLGATSASVESVQVGAEGGLEGAARKARRDALLQVAAGRPILLGHTADDQAETVLLRLLRGSGAHSLSAMSQVEYPWFRPFLYIRRSVITDAVVEILTPLGIEPWNDPHNSDPEFARVKMRSTLERLTVDFGPSVSSALVRTADMLRADDSALEKLAEDFCLATGLSVAGDQQVDIAQISELPEAIRTRVIRRMYSLCVGIDRESSPLTYNHVHAMDALITNWHGQGVIALPLGASALREYGRLRVYRSAGTKNQGTPGS
jgi:tRNA(Ile)-lysidine synthase